MSRLHLAILGDTHADETSRFDEHNQVLDWIADDACDRGCHAMIHTGDVYERKSTARERLALAAWVRKVTGQMPLVIVRGNHDDPLDIELLGKLKTYGHKVHAITRPEVVDLGGALVACLPWPSKAGLLAADAKLSHEESDRQARLMLKAILRHLGDQMRGDSRPHLFAGHVMMRGSRTSVSQPPLVGMDLELTVDDLALVDAIFYALGHIHLGQEWHVAEILLGAGGGAGVAIADSVPAIYPGSPRRCNYGEVEPKSYVVAEFYDGRLAGWQRVATPCRGMLHVEGDFVPAYDDRGPIPAGFLLTSSTKAPTDDEVKNAEVRVRYRVAPERRAEAKQAMAVYREQLLMQGAHSVKLEERVIPQARARAPEVASRPSLAGKLDAYWDSQGKNAPAAELRGRLHELLAGLAMEAP